MKIVVDMMLRNRRKLLQAHLNMNNQRCQPTLQGAWLKVAIKICSQESARADK